MLPRYIALYRQYIATQDFQIQLQAGAGLKTLTVTRGTRYRSPAEAATALTTLAAGGLTFTLSQTTGAIVVTGAATWAVDFGATSLGVYLGWTKAIIDQTDTHGACLGWLRCSVRESLGYQQRLVSVDGAHHDGRIRSDLEAVTTDRVSLWLHRRSDTATLKEAMDAAYAAADVLVRGRIALYASETDSWHYGAIGKGWEMQPVSLDDAAVYMPLALLLEEAA